MDVQKRNFIIIWISNFLVAGTMTMIMPFLSLYIETFGDYSDAYVQKWSGLIFGASFVTAFIMSPIWGRVADKYGFKPILTHQWLRDCNFRFSNGICDSVEMFFLLRLLNGVVTGFIPTSLAFISSQTAKEEAGKMLGTLQMGSVTGTLFGPVFGGLLADAFGFQYTFVITSISVIVAALIVLFGIKEQKRVKNPKAIQYSRKAIIKRPATSPAHVECHDCYGTYPSRKLQYPTTSVALCFSFDRCKRRSFPSWDYIQCSWGRQFFIRTPLGQAW